MPLCRYFVLFVMAWVCCAQSLQAQTDTTPKPTDSLKQFSRSQLDSAKMVAQEAAIRSMMPSIMTAAALAQQSNANAYNTGNPLLQAWGTNLQGVTIAEVYNTGNFKDPKGKRSGGLQDYIAVRLNKPAPWLRDERWRGQLCLTINGMPLNKVRPLYFNNDSLFTFYLERGDSANQATWDILQQFEGFNFRHPVTVSIGTPGLPSVKAAKGKAPGNFELIIVYWQGFLLMLGGIALLLFIIWKFRKSRLFRDHPQEHLSDLSFEPTYSLARVQLGFWTVLILGCELYIWAITGVLPDLTTSSLILLGVSVGTTALSGSVGRFSNIKVRKTTGNFLLDMISDSDGIPSLHRFQMVGWTVILGVYFVRETWLHFSMPIINDNMLILMGLSSGTYVTLKTQEGKSAPTTTVTPANPAAPVDPAQPVNPDPNGNTAATDADDHEEPAVG